MIKVVNVEKSFGDLKVLKGITHTFEKNKTTVIIGSSGSGKSTLLRCLNNLENKNSGDIIIDNKLIEEYTQEELVEHVGMVFQHFNLFSGMTVIDNVAYALKKVKKIPAEKAYEIALEGLKKVNMADKINVYPKNLSGGQKQRVAIARALVMEPKIMLFDEPTSALDPESVNEILLEIKKLTHTGLTSIIVTHEMGFAKEVADEVIYMDDGKIVEFGNADALFNNAKEPRTKQFLNKIL